MSRRWSRSLQLRVGPAWVEATVRQGWARRAPEVHAQRKVAATAIAGSGDFDALAKAIEAVLAEIGTRIGLKGLGLEVALSSALIHLDVAQGDFAGQADRQLQAIACACVDEMKDDDDAQEVRWHLQRDARHMLIAAIPRALLEMLQAIAQRTGLRLRGVAPEFVVRWNQFGRIAGCGHWVFAVSSPGDLAIAMVADGALSSVSIGPGIDLPDAAAAKRQPGPDALDSHVDRLLYSCGDDPATQARFVLVTHDPRQTPASERWTLARTEAAA